MVTLTIATSMGELTSVPLNATTDDVVKMLDEGGSINVELPDGRVVYLTSGMLDRSVVFIDNVPE